MRTPEDDRRSWGSLLGCLQQIEAGLLLFGLLAGHLAAVAADKNGVSPNTISVPKGPGSIEGLGESFQPTLNTGTAKYGIGLRVPPGTAGNAPALKLNYDGGGGNGPLGFGWDLSFPSVRRQSDEGIPTYGANVGFARTDRFIDSSKEELVPQANGDFFVENEGSFLRYRQQGIGWLAHAPDGTRLEFGVQDAAARIQDTTNRIYCWLLEREIDTRGNTIVYSYTNYPGDQNANQKYLDVIRYGPGSPPWQHYHFVRFIYEDRPDWFEDCRAGFPVRTGKRLKQIVVGTHTTSLPGHLAGDWDGDGASDFLVRRYELAYLDYAGPNSHWSLLARVTPIGADGVSALPSSDLAYSVCNPPDTLSASGHILGGENEPDAVMDNGLVDFVDLNGDALPDLLETGGTSHRAFLNLGETTNGTGRVIRWAVPTEMGSPDQDAWTFNLGETRTHLADMDGDALADLVHKSAEGSVFFFRNRGRKEWDIRQPMTAGASLPPAPFGVTDVRTGDIDFDKRIDLIRGDGLQYEVWFNAGSNTYSEAIAVAQASPFSFTDSAVQLADLNGDRVPDVAQIHSAGVDVTAGLGYGRFASLRSILLPDYTLDPTELTLAKLIDITEDGLADLVIERSSSGDLWFWINLGNYQFGSRKTITGMPTGLGTSPAIRWADLNGNGSTDLVLADSTWNPRLTAVEIGELLNGGLPPNSLTAISNGLGRVTLIGYAPSTRFALEDAAAGQAWTNTLPNPVTVVAAVTNLDSLGHQYITQFRYHEGYYDSLEKQFRGFSRVEQVDLGDPTAPTLVSRSHFDVGRVHEALKGKLLAMTVERENGQVFSSETSVWTVPPVVLYAGTNGQNVNFVHLLSTSKTIEELGQGTARVLESELNFDSFGNQILDANYGIVEGTNRSAFDDERIVITDYAINTNAWILRTPQRVRTLDENGAVISKQEFFYDDETFSGSNLGTVSIGNLTLKREWITPSDPQAFVQASRAKFDTYGNSIMLLDPMAVAPGGSVQLGAGHARALTYETRFHTFPLTETIHVGNGSSPLFFQAEYDEGFGIVTATTDFNTNRTEYTYDTLARLTGIIRPNDSPAFPTIEYGYGLAVPAPYWKPSNPTASTGLVNYVETRQLDREPGSAGPHRDHYIISRQYSDGLGRTLMTRGEAEPALGQQNPRVVVNGASLFNARQKPALALNAFFTLKPGSLEDQLDFENIEAPGWTGQFHENGSLVALPLDTAHKSSLQYDATLRTTRVTNADGTQQRTDFEPLLTRAFDENDTATNSPSFGTPMVSLADGLGRLIRVDEIVRLNDDGTPASNLQTWTTRYQYDLNDRLTRITDSQDNVKLLKYDALKRKTWMNDPDSGISTNVYDHASNLIETTDAKGQRITYTYDGANRLLSEDYHDEESPKFGYQRSPDVSYHYDVPGGPVDQGNGSTAVARNTRGLLAWVEDTSGEEHTSFDVRGRTEWTVKRVPDPVLNSNLNTHAHLVSYQTRFRYDSLDRLQNLVYPDNDEVTYSYNARGLLDNIAGGPSGHILKGIGYLPSAQQHRIDHGNGVRTTYEYDRRQRLNHLLTVSHPETLNQQLINFGYDLDGVSNVRAIDDLRPESLVPANNPRRNTQRFQYDDLYRLTQVAYNPAAGTSQPSTNVINYRYDRLGNMLSQASDITDTEKGLPLANLGAISYGGAAGRHGRQGRLPEDPPGPHALSHITSGQPGVTNRAYAYDANGNMTKIDSLHCTWDFMDRLVVVEDDSVKAEYRYDYTGRRITKRVLWKQGEPPPPGAPPITNQPPSLSAVSYPGRHFEIRDHDEPTKFVPNGDTRVARVTGSLSAAARLQRLRLHPGWNLCSLAISVTNVLQQLTNQPSPVLSIDSVFAWNSSVQHWSPMAAGDVLPAGAILWIQAAAAATVVLTGIYEHPTNRSITSAGLFCASAGLEAWNIGKAFSGRTSVATWGYDAAAQRWTSWLPPPLTAAGATARLSHFAAPGSAVFVRTEVTAELEVPAAALRIRYYHADHLGSSSVITDAEGGLVEETAFYPFGAPRQNHRLQGLDECYKFGQKELDRESDLQYFEARYLSGVLSRFAIPDPKYTRLENLETDDLENFLVRPQNLNLYAYAANNPLRYTDPSGLDNLDPANKVSDTAGAIAAGVDEVDNIVVYVRGVEFVGDGLSTATAVVGKTTAVVGVAIQGARFLNDPSSATGGQLLNETAKTLTGIAIPPVGLIWAIADLTGYGPSALLEATEKSIQANRAATKAYKQATAAAKQTVALVAKAEPEIRRKHAGIRSGLDKLNAETKRWHAKSLASLKGEKRSLAELNAAYAKEKRRYRQSVAELKYWQARAKKAQQE